MVVQSWNALRDQALDLSLARAFCEECIDERSVDRVVDMLPVPRLISTRAEVLPDLALLLDQCPQIMRRAMTEALNPARRQPVDP